MFSHLFQGSAPWVLGALELGLVVHIASGVIAILSGAGALVVRKGGDLHRQFGTAFFVAMLSMSVAAAILAIAAVALGHWGQVGNIFGGAFAFYLVSTGWLAIRRPQGVIGGAEIFACAGALIIAAVALFWLLPMTLGPEGKALGVPGAAPIILAAVATLLAGLDISMIVKRGLTGIGRVRRHLWRMCLGLFFATGSFFIGQQQDMPAMVQGSPALLILGFSPLIAMLFWLVRISSRRPRDEVPATSGSFEGLS